MHSLKHKDLESKYFDRITRNKYTKMISCKFNNKEEIEIFKKEQNIKFKRSNLDTLEGIEYENKRISSVLNLRERLVDTDLSKEYCNKLGIANAKVIIYGSKYNKDGTYKQGAAVHISTNHEEIGNSKENISNILNSFINPDELRIFVPLKQKTNTERYIFATIYSEKRVYYAILDIINKNEFELFDVYFKERNNMNNNLKNNIIREL